MAGNNKQNLSKNFSTSFKKIPNKSNYEGTAPARGDLAKKLALLTPRTKNENTTLHLNVIAKPTLLGPR